MTIDPSYSASLTDGQADVGAVRSVSDADRRAVAVWLFCVCALLAAMILVGGATRLTDSGLSITEWKPVTGAVPPLSEAQWLAEFEKYKQIPEYQIVNKGMSLEAFKTIYWWEWGHRFLGRLIGLAFAVPFVFVLVTKRVDRALAPRLALMLVLGGAQGALGWFMVKSGLTERVDVSQYRLTAHLGLAFALFALIFWTAWGLVRPRAQGAGSASQSAVRWSAALAVAAFVQILLGGFVAGLNAGYMFNTWPLMDGALIPAGYFSASPFETALGAQFNHRLGAYVLCAVAVAAWVAARRTPARAFAHAALGAVGLQAALGVWTLVAAVPTSLGLAHQAGAILVFSAALALAYETRRSRPGAPG